MQESMSILQSINIHELITTYLIPWGKNIVLAVLIFIIGRYIASLLKGVVRKVLINAKVDTILIIRTVYFISHFYTLIIKVILQSKS